MAAAEKFGSNVSACCCCQKAAGRLLTLFDPLPGSERSTVDGEWPTASGRTPAARLGGRGNFNQARASGSALGCLHYGACGDGSKPSWSPLCVAEAHISTVWDD